MAAAAPATAQNARVFSTFRESPAAVKAILIGMLVNRLGTFLNIFLVLYMTHRGFTQVQAGTALGVYGFGGVAGVLAGTALADKLGARRATVLSMGGRAVLMIGILYLRNFPALLVDVAVVGMIGLVYRPASASLLAELTPKDRQVMIFAVYRLCTNLGTTLSPLFGALLILVSYNLLFWGDAITSMGYAVIALILLPRRVDQAGQATVRRRRLSGLGVVFADRRYVLFLVALMINATVYIQYVAILPLAMAAAHIATAWYAVVLSLNSVIVITCELLMTKVTQRWPARTVALAGFLLLGIGQALYWFPGGLIVFIGGPWCGRWRRSRPDPPCRRTRRTPALTSCAASTWAPRSRCSRSASRSARSSACSAGTCSAGRSGGGAASPPSSAW
jgi:MFS family permease